MTLDGTTRLRIRHCLHAVVLVLALALIIFISYDTFTNRPFLNNHVYMTFQFWVCVVFILDFMVQFYIAEDRWKFFRHYFFFLLISIPYLNIITRAGVVLTSQQLYLVRFIPLIRAAAALAIVISYVSKNKIVGLFATYTSIMVLVVYFASLIFLQREQGVNPDITGYWTSLWWCCLETTTIGAPINPCTPTGRVLAAVLSGMGMIMFPLFTVYLTSMVRKYMKAKPKTVAVEKS